MVKTDDKKRIVWIDWAKSICIFLMVVGHWTSNSTLLLYIYSFHMPALFAVSGILFKPHSWINTILSFAIPVAFFSFVNIIFLLCIGELCINQLLSKDVLFRFFHFRYGLGEGFYCGDWFLWALLGLRLFYGDISSLLIMRRYYFIICTCIVVYMSIEEYMISIDTLFRGWYIGRFVPSMPFFCLGFLMKDIGLKHKETSLLTMCLLGTAMLALPVIIGHCSINSNSYGLSYVLFFINASLSSLFILLLSDYMPKMKFVSIISKGTLLILGLHIPIMRTLDIILPSCMHDYLPFLVLPLCYYPILLLDKWCPALLGRVYCMRRDERNIKKCHNS